MIVQELHEIQHHHGFLPEKELRALAARTGTRLHRLQEVASFFPHFRLTAPDPIQVRICQDMSCQIRGACDLIKKFQKAADKFKGPKLDVQGVSCLGRCDRAPAAFVGATIKQSSKSNTNGSDHPQHHEHVHYYMNVDQPKLAAIVKKTALAVKNDNADQLPASETDVDWQPSQTKQWSIDVYDGLPDTECYQAIRQFMDRRSDQPQNVDRYNLKNTTVQFQSNQFGDEPLTHADYERKALLLNFWKTGCDASDKNTESLHNLLDAIEQRPDRNSKFPFIRNGLNVLNINTDDSDAVVKEYCEKMGIVWPQITGVEASKIRDDLRIQDTPSVVLIDMKGRVVSSRNTVDRLDPLARSIVVESALRANFENMNLESQRILCSLFTGNLLGMGGAGGRAYKKWFEVFQAAGDTKYVVCNGDESEPGTFKDREILLRSPHLVVEAVTLAGLLVGAERGYIYIRHEFEEQIQSVRNEIKRAERLGLSGENIMGTELSFPVEVFVSPGGYICGEQTALIEAMEDKRAEPRNRPPELQTNGLWDCPTLLNNVETLAWVPAIVLREDGQWFANSGSVENKSFKGKRFFSISGDVENPGAYEVPIGITFGELVNDFAGGMKDGMAFKAAALSGPSGGFTPRMIPVEFLPQKWTSRNLPEDATHFDLWTMPLDIPVSREIGIMMGAGMVVFGDQTDLVQTALSATTFYRNESCGKCVPCRIGSQKLVELLTDIAERKYTMKQIYGESSNSNSGFFNHDVAGMHGLVGALSETMKLTAICGLGTVASNPIATLLTYFRDDVARYANKES